MGNLFIGSSSNGATKSQYDHLFLGSGLGSARELDRCILVPSRRRLQSEQPVQYIR
jgi:hypothetical protein